eukprot:3316334-Lingulodinium_polyedra.AAC.1
MADGIYADPCGAIRNHLNMRRAVPFLGNERCIVCTSPVWLRRQPVVRGSSTPVQVDTARECPQDSG